MKKIIIMAIAAAMVTLTSCSNKNNTNAENAENTETGIGAETIEAQADSSASVGSGGDERQLYIEGRRGEQAYEILLGHLFERHEVDESNVEPRAVLRFEAVGDGGRGKALGQNE